jgi:protein TonB
VKRIRVGQNVQAAKLTNPQNLEYPPLAKEARVEGRVQFNVLIDKSGRIARMTVLSGHPLLIPAAQEALKQYEYKTTMLNGDPVEVATYVDVIFRLP